ncbi:hypothetical protein LguiA_029849 [Lonicera macranthoides]
MASCRRPAFHKSWEPYDRPSASKAGRSINRVAWGEYEFHNKFPTRAWVEFNLKHELKSHGWRNVAALAFSKLSQASMEYQRKPQQFILPTVAGIWALENVVSFFGQELERKCAETIKIMALNIKKMGLIWAPHQKSNTSVGRVQAGRYRRKLE